MAVSAPIVLNTSRKVIGVVILVNIRQFPPPSLHSFSSLHLFPACHLRSKANTLTSIGCFIAVAIYKVPLPFLRFTLCAHLFMISFIDYIDYCSQSLPVEKI
ncbi:hypothetical protein SAY86_007218 [Trapa natans]|uniref:Uncharacterized protein n=1 Tax=Trapa natans TaxID=22666 RepID=A0AAN7LE63_TRANT|nr:hypothetical protein SAY86_007218 [Trapa natans]